MKMSRKEIFGLILLLFSLLSFITILGYDPSEQPGGLYDNADINSTLGGYFGIFIPYYYYMTLGYASIAIPALLCILGFILFTNKKIQDFYKIFLYILLSAIWVSTFISYLSYYNSAGLIGNSLNIFLGDIFGKVGFILILYTSLILLIALILNFSIYQLFKNIYHFCKNKIYILYKKIFDSYSHFLDKKNNEIIINTDTSNDEMHDSVISNESLVEAENLDNQEDDPIEENNENKEIDSDEIVESVDLKDPLSKEDSDSNQSFVIEDEEEIVEGDMEAEIKKQNKYLQYKLPDISYLDDSIEIKTHNEDELKQKADQLAYALNSFGVSGNVVKISPGPVITLFEIEPAEGVRVSKFTNLSEDLSRIMGGKRVRIIAPIPGSKSVGVELPN